MFPPQPTQDVQELVSCLAASLQRAGENIVLLPEVAKKGEELYQVRLRLAVPMPKAAVAHATGYIKDYAKESRWRAHRVVIDRRYISFFVSRAPSKTSRNR